MLTFSVPPGYRRTKPPSRPKLEAFTAIIDAILAADRASPPKQRHTAKRIFERLRAERGFAGGYTIIKDYLREQHARTQEVFVPLAHPPGHAQVDFGEAVAVIGGVQQKIHSSSSPGDEAGFRLPVPSRLSSLAGLLPAPPSSAATRWRGQGYEAAKRKARHYDRMGALGLLRWIRTTAPA